MKITNNQYLLNLAMDAKKASCNDNYYLDRLVCELKDKVIKEKSFKSLVNGYLSKLKKQRPNLYGYTVVGNALYLSDSFSFIRVWSSKDQAILLKSFSDINNNNITKGIEYLLDEYNNTDSEEIEENIIKLDMIDTKMQYDFYPLGNNCTVDIEKLMYIAQINKVNKILISYNKKEGSIYVLDEAYGLLGIVKHCKPN